MPEGEAAETFRYLALLLGLAPEDAAPQLHLLYFAARRFLECVGDEQPTVFVFEDIHWAKPSEIALLEYLDKHLRDSPVMFVAAARPELLDDASHVGCRAGRAKRRSRSTRCRRKTRRRWQPAAPGAEGRGRPRTDRRNGGRQPPLPRRARRLARRGRCGRGPADHRPRGDRGAHRCAPARMPARAARPPPSSVGPSGAASSTALGDGRTSTRGARAARDPRVRPARSIEPAGRRRAVHLQAHAHPRSGVLTVPRAVRRARHAAVARYIEETAASPGAALATILAHHWREAGEPTRAIPYSSAADTARRSWAQDTVDGLYSMAIDLARDDTQRRRIRLDAESRSSSWPSTRAQPRSSKRSCRRARGPEAARRADRARARVRLDRAGAKTSQTATAAPLLPEVGDATARAGRPRAGEPGAGDARSRRRGRPGVRARRASAPDLGARGEDTVLTHHSTSTPTRPTGRAGTNARSSSRARRAR